MGNKWIYPTNNVLEEYNRALKEKQNIDKLYSDIDKLQRQIEAKRKEIKYKNEAEPNYNMFFYKEMINLSKEELIKGIKIIKGWSNINEFQTERLKTLENLLKNKK